MSDLVASMAMDTHDFIAPINEAAKKVEEMASVSVDAMKKVESAIDPATDAMTRQGDESAKSAQKVQASHQGTHRAVDAMSSAFWIALKPATAMMGIAGLFVPKLRAWALGMGVVSGAHSVLAGYSTATSKANEREAASIERLNKAKARQAGEPSGRKGEDQSSTSISVGGVAAMTANAAAAWVLYKSGIDEVVSAGRRHLDLNSDMMQALGGLAQTAGSIATTAMDMLSEGIKGSAVALLQFTTGFGSITEAVDFGAATITSWAKSAQSGLDVVKNSARDAGLVFGTALAIFQSGGTIDAAAFYEEGQALQKMAEESERVAQKQMIMKDALGVVTSAITAAENNRQIALDKARVSQITTVDGINAEIAALRQRIVATDSSIQKTKEWKKYTTDLTTALENQRTAIMSGQQGAAVDDSKSSQAADKFKALNDEIYKLTFGEEAATRATLAAAAASDEEAAALLEAAAAVDALKNAKKAQEAQDKATEKGTQQLSKLKDEYDLLTGAATKAQIAMREQLREGVPEELAAQIAEMEGKVAGLKEKDKAKDGGKDKDNQAAEEGTSKAAELVLRGVGGGPSKLEELGEEQLEVEEEQVAVLNKIHDNGIALFAGNFT